MALRRISIGLFRRFRSFVLGSDVKIAGRCLMCGNCCRDIHLHYQGWIKDKRRFDKLCRKLPGHTRFEPTGRKDEGLLLFRCTFQNADGLCDHYEDRLSLCRRYPSKTIYYNGGQLGSDCGFRFESVTFREVLFGKKTPGTSSFARTLQRELKLNSERSSEEEQ